MKKFLFIGLAVLVALLGCNLMTRDFYRTAEDFPENGKGLLILVLDGSEVEGHTIAPPDGTMNINGYVIKGWAPGSDPDSDTETWSATTSLAVYTRNDLMPGVWTIDVTARNSTPVDIGYDRINVTVEPNSMVTANAIVEPFTGGSFTGLLDLDIYWIANTVPDPQVVAILTGVTAGTASNSSFGDQFDVITTTGAGFTTPVSLIAGYYTLNITLNKDYPANPVKVMGDMQSVRIVSGETSTGSWDLTGTTGDATVIIDSNLKNPIEIEIITIDATGGTGITATANLVANLPILPPAPPTYYVRYDYDWYLDGVPIANVGEVATTSNLLDETLPISDGAHNLSVIVTAYIKEDVTPSSVVDSVSSQTESFSLMVPPIPGNTGTITVADSGSGSDYVTLDWTAATDNWSAQAALEYLAYYSENPSLGTVTEIEANGIAVDSYAAAIVTKVVPGLTSGTTYYFNVIVKDEAGNKAAYTTTSSVTKD